jgi:predicted metal-dependent hydrolase
MSKGLSIPFEVADGIVLASLQEQRRYLKSELKQWEKNPKTDSNPDGYWLHPEDVVKNTVLIRCMDELIKYYGAE